MYVTLKAQCNMLNIGDERIMHNSLMTTSCHVYLVGHLLQKNNWDEQQQTVKYAIWWYYCNKEQLLMGRVSRIANKHAQQEL